MAEVKDTHVEDSPRSPRERAGETARAARDRATEAARRAREKAAQAAETARERGRRAVTRGNDLAVENPLIAIAGGVVIGALIAGLLPRTAQEDRVAGKVGRKVRAQAKKTARNVRDNAKTELDELGLNMDNVKKQVKGLADKLGQAADGSASEKGGKSKA